MDQTKPKEDWRVEAGRKGNAARKTRNNQYSAGSMTNARAEDMRARIQTGIMLTKLHKDATGQVPLTDGQRASIKLLIDKAMPTLQAVEATQLEPAMVLSEEDILTNITLLLKQRPDLINRAQAELAKEQANPVSDASQPTGVQPQQSDKSAA